MLLEWIAVGTAIDLETRAVLSYVVLVFSVFCCQTSASAVSLLLVVVTRCTQLSWRFSDVDTLAGQGFCGALCVACVERINQPCFSSGWQSAQPLTDNTLNLTVHALFGYGFQRQMLESCIGVLKPYRTWPCLSTVFGVRCWRIAGGGDAHTTLSWRFSGV